MEIYEYAKEILVGVSGPPAYEIKARLSKEVPKPLHQDKDKNRIMKFGDYF